LTPELKAVLPAGRLFPAGTVFVAAAGSWRPAGVFANLTGTLREPGRLPQRAEIGLVRRAVGGWSPSRRYCDPGTRSQS